MSTYQSITILGNMGNDPEVRYMENGTCVANLSLATSEKWKDKQTGQPMEKTEWHRVSLFGKVAEVAGEYLKKGDKALIIGQLRTRKWQDQSGQDRYTTEVVGRELKLMGGSQSGSGAQGGSTYPQGRQSAPAASQPPPSDFPVDDDIPF